MNKKNNIDQLFANKLQNASATPSKAAWKQLEANLAKDKQNKAGLWMKIAAAVIILIISALSWKFFTIEDASSNQFANASEEFLQAPYPKQIQIGKIELTGIIAVYEAYQAENEKMKKNIFSVQPSNASQHLPSISDQKMKELVAIQESKNNQSKEIEDKEPIGNPIVEPVITPIETAVALQESPTDVSTEIVAIDPAFSERMEKEIDHTMTVADNSDELPKVTITYLGQEEPEKEKAKFSIKKVFSSAKKLANGELIAELRDAKDDFINSRFKTVND